MQKYQKKVTIIGAGAVGATLAYTLSFQNEISQITMIDIDTKRLEGEIYDLDSCNPKICHSRIKEGTYADCQDSDIIVVTAGVNRSIGQERADLYETNRNIMRTIVDQIKKYYVNAFLIIVSNPVDELTAFVEQYGEFKKEKICGTGCFLDLARVTSILAKYLKIGKENILLDVYGRHGVELEIQWDTAIVEGISLEAYCCKNNICWGDEQKQIIQKQAEAMGMNIIERKGKTIYGIASATAYLIQQILQDECTPVIVGTSMGNEEQKVHSKLVYAGKGMISFL